MVRRKCRSKNVFSFHVKSRKTSLALKNKGGIATHKADFLKMSLMRIRVNWYNNLRKQFGSVSQS
jgi:hypothetical protein